ncbi:MAG: AmmeMemoRadiSam system protein B [Bdellovibrionota bacterium]
MTKNIALPKMARYFYPENTEKLNNTLKEFISDTPTVNKKPLALIVPHAGYIFSGEIAGKAYSILNGYKDEFDTVVIIGPSHKVLLRKPAVLNMDYALPTGILKKDEILIDELLKDNLVDIDNDAHNGEHSIEVQLPFLHYINPNFKIVNILSGAYELDDVVKLIDALFKIPRVHIVISSDLSHFNSYDIAKQVDKETIKNVLELNDEAIKSDDACGAVGIKALIKIARKYFLKPKVLGYCNSGDKTADKQKVVGYASFGFFNS